MDDEKQKDNLTELGDLMTVPLMDDDAPLGTVVGQDGNPVTLGGGGIARTGSLPSSSYTNRSSNFQIKKK